MSMEVSIRIPGLVLALLAAGGLPGAALADPPTLSTTGCPVFHCNLEATGVMRDSIVDFQHQTALVQNSTLGNLKFQGCAGDGTLLACLFSTDNVTSGVTRGTLKVIDPATLQPIWGSAGVSGSYDIAASEFLGQVPLIYADGRVSAGDVQNYVLYAATGEAEKKIALNGRGKNMGMTPISDRYGVISQSTGTLTLIDRINWVSMSRVTLVDEGGSPVTLVSPSTGSNGVLYAVAKGSRSGGLGYLYAVDLLFDAQGTPSLRPRSPFIFLGQSGASVVVVKPQITGLPNSLLLLHVPGLPGDSTPRSRLMGLLDNGSALVQAWPQPITLAGPMKFSPAIDEVSRSLFFQLSSGSVVYQHDLLMGVLINQFDLRFIGGFPSGFGLNGHLPSNQANGAFTLFLSGSSGARRGGQKGQYVMGFQPLVSPGNLLWSAKISGTPDGITEAWSIGPANNVPGTYCPIVVGDTSGITRICNVPN